MEPKQNKSQSSSNKQMLPASQHAVAGRPAVLSKHNKLHNTVVLTERDAQVAYYLVRGHTYSQIAEMLGFGSTQTIWASVQRCLTHWRESIEQNIDTLLGMELQKTLAMEAEAWAAWERSKNAEYTERRTKGVTDVGELSEPGPGLQLDTTEIVVTRKEQAGDPRFLAIVDKCIDKRCQLLGLYAPTRLAMHGGTGGQEDVDENAKTKLISRLLSNAASRGAQGSSGQS